MGGWIGDRANINRKGRPPKGETLTDALREYAEKKDVDFGDQKLSRKQALSQKLWQMALGGDMQAMKYIYDRIDGTPTQTISSPDGGVLIVKVELVE